MPIALIKFLFFITFMPIFIYQGFVSGDVVSGIIIGALAIWLLSQFIY